MKKIESFYYFNSRQKFVGVILLIVVVGIFLFVSPVKADVGDVVVSVLSWLCMKLITFFGWVLVLLIDILVKVAAYNNFMNEQPVVLGWQLVRDVCNMFFVIILLVIAFSTVLGIQSYSYRSLLKKLIIMALLINFSKTITAFIIDVSQVVMLSFVNAFRDAGYNIVALLGLTDYTTLSESAQDIDDTKILAALLLGLLLIIISTVVVLIFLIILIVRIVYLWLLMVLSPFAYLLTAAPGKGSAYASQWWDLFTKQLIVGPLLAFFLWLALASAGSGGQVGLTNPDGSPLAITPSQSASKSTSEIMPAAGTTTGDNIRIPTEAADPVNLLRFIIGIAMLIAGLTLTQEIGGVAGSIAGKGLAKIKGVGTGLLTGKIGPTPMRWARERFEAYRGMRKDIRMEKAKAGGAKLLALEGGIKKGVTAPVRGITEGVRGVIDKRFEEPKKLREEARQLRLQGKGKEAIELEARAKESEARLAERKVFTPLMITRRYWDKKGEVQDSYASQLREEDNTAEALKFEGKARTSRRIGKTVQSATTGGAAFASLVGGPLVAGVGLSLLGGKFLNWQGKYQAKEAERYQERARNWKYHEVMKAKDEDKNKNDYDLKTRSEDPSVSPINRMADILLRLEKGKYSSAEVGKLKAQMQTLGADQSTLSNFDRLVVEKFPQHSNRYNMDPETGEPLDVSQTVQRISDDIKIGDLTPHDFDASSLTSRGGITAYATLLSATTEQLKKLVEKSPNFREKLGEGSGKYLLTLKLDNTQIQELLKTPEGEKELKKITKVTGRHFYTTKDNNRFKDIFNLKDDGKIGNEELFKEILKTDDAIQLIANLKTDQFINKQQKEAVIKMIINNVSGERLNKSAVAANAGKDWQREWVNEILSKILAVIEDPQIKDKEPQIAKLGDYVAAQAMKRSGLGELEVAEKLRKYYRENLEGGQKGREETIESSESESI